MDDRHNQSPEFSALKNFFVLLKLFSQQLAYPYWCYFTLRFSKYLYRWNTFVKPLNPKTIIIMSDIFVYTRDVVFSVYKTKYLDQHKLEFNNTQKSTDKLLGKLNNQIKTVWWNFSKSLR